MNRTTEVIILASFLTLAAIAILLAHDADIRRNAAARQDKSVASTAPTDEAAIEANRPPWEEVGEFSPIPFGEAAPRGHEWAKVSADFRKFNPTCAACGCDQVLAVHHVKPWRLCIGPDEWKRLDPSNLVALCCCKTHQCHWREGHLSLSWRASNPDVKADAREFLARRQAAILALRKEANPPAEDSEE